MRYGGGAYALVYETKGRLGQAGIETLEAFASVAAAGGQEGARRMVVGEWRGRLERALLYAQADITILALGRASGLALGFVR